jgi:hypothetical protein
MTNPVRLARRGEATCGCLDSDDRYSAVVCGESAVVALELNETYFYCERHWRECKASPTLDQLRARE